MNLMPSKPDYSRLLLPAGTRLVHIGPPKTGTTSLQSAFHTGRKAVAAQGVHYAGRHRQPATAVRAVAGLVDPMTGVVPSTSEWDDVVDRIDRASKPRTLLSSEYLSRAQPDAIRRIIADLGEKDVRIAVTLRPLAKVLPSQWQQFVRNRMTRAYDEWLDIVINQPASKTGRNFWIRHRHDELVARWAEVVGPERVHVIALDDRDHDMVVRVFEGLLGITPGTLVPVDDLSNRSLTQAEIELLRAFNKQYHAQGLGIPLYHEVVTRGAAFYIKFRQPGPDEPRIPTPEWALDGIAAIAREMVDNIVGSGVHIVGDPAGLATRAAGPSGDPSIPPQVPVDVAATALMGILVGSGLTNIDAGTWRRSGNVIGSATRGGLTLVPSSQLAIMLTRRTGKVIQKRIRRFRRRILRRKSSG